jgi:hypothetical protein
MLADVFAPSDFELGCTDLVKTAQRWKKAGYCQAFCESMGKFSSLGTQERCQAKVECYHNKGCLPATLNR